MATSKRGGRGGKRHSGRGHLYSMKQQVTIVFTAVVAALAVLITLKSEFGFPFPVPTWRELYASAGLSEEEVTLVEGELSVHMIDVGQGDSILIRTDDGHAMLVDAGERDQGETVVSYLAAQGIDRLDLVVGSHPHTDHIGGLQEVIESVETDLIWMPPLADELLPDTRTFENLLEAIDAGGIPLETPEVGERYQLGEAEVTVLGPNDPEDDNLNNQSLVLRVDFGGSSLLMTGDTEQPGEDLLLEGDLPVAADLLKVGHHGSNSSSGDDFLDAVDPAIALISCGEGNSYGHPHAEVLERLEAREIEIHRTDIEGSIVLISDGTDFRLAA